MKIVFLKVVIGSSLTDDASPLMLHELCMASSHDQNADGVCEYQHQFISDDSGTDACIIQSEYDSNSELSEDSDAEEVIGAITSSNCYHGKNGFAWYNISVRATSQSRKHNTVIKLPAPRKLLQKDQERAWLISLEIAFYRRFDTAYCYMDQ